MKFENVPDAVRRRMSQIRGKNTGPELLIRKELHARGYRYRLHRRGLPGSPDIVFPSRRKAIWVHGCFWHSHGDPACPIAKTPQTRTEYWAEKLARNRERDERNQAAIETAGWLSLVVWECQLSSSRRTRTLEEVLNFLERE